MHLAAGSEQNKIVEKNYRIKIDGETQLFGLIGSNIGYTKSPAMHNRAAQILGINAVYLPLHIDAGKVLDFLDIALHMNFGGFNVTQPHKEIAAKSLPSTKLKSINTICRTENGWTAASTDGTGFVAGFKRVGREFNSFENVVFIGAGGAVTAILEFLAIKKAEMPRVTILRRSSSKDSELKKIVGKKASFLDLSVANLTEQLNDKGPETLLVQASSAPLHGDDLSAYTPALNGFNGVVCDLIYSNPSKLYFAALNLDLAALDGEAMLIEQARAAQKIWWGKAASYEEMSAALRGK